MQIKERKLRKIIREEILRESRSMKYSEAAEDAYHAIQTGDEREYLLEVRSMLHAVESLILNGEQMVNDKRMDEALDCVSDAQIILKELQRE